METIELAGKTFEVDEDGFILEAPGIYGTGCVKRPLDVATSVQDATGAALRAIQSAVRR